MSGEARTQVAQLISGFNELISTQTQWRDSYAKVNAHLTALLGPDPVASDPTNASGTAARRHIGCVRGNDRSGSPRETRRAAYAPDGVREAAAAVQRAHAAGTTDPASSTGAASSAANPPATAAPEQKPTPTQPPTAQPTQTTGTSGAATTTQGTSDVMKHVAAIEALLKMQDDSGGLTLTKAQVEQLRTHWAALRTAIEKK